MEAKRRYTIMVFPQGFNGKKLAVNLVLIPRNQDPFKPYPTGLAAPHGLAIPFADLVPQFEIKVVKGLEEWPISNASTPAHTPQVLPITVKEATNKNALLQALAADFGARINSTDTDKAEANEFVVSKYLPESYREAFNFTTPRHKNAKTDDSYHCAIRKDIKKKEDWKNTDDLSWGQVFAHILRQPILARACGLIYSAEVAVDAHPDWFNKGAYIYADIVNPDYRRIQDELLKDANGPFIKRYAARLPKLVVDKKRPVFAPLLIPVLYQNGVVDAEPPNAPWDAIFSEINEYNDGFAKIVHAAQPVSSNLLSEKQDAAHPVNDVGFRLAWDDEQILIWYIRQLTHNPDEPGKRIDVPLGVYGYRIDVKKEGAANWNSLNLVKSKQQYKIGNATVGNAANEMIELPYQVFPTQPDNDTNGSYWLPMYFTNWIGKSLVLKDTDAVKIYRNDEGFAPLGAPKNVSPTTLFDEVAAEAKLFYGNTYEFRVRMMDISGGGPVVQDELFNNGASPNAKKLFKRYIAPGLCMMHKPDSLLHSKTEFFNETKVGGESVFDATPFLKIKRPLLSYPAVVFTGKYQAKGLDPVQLLINSPHVETAPDGKKSFTPALADPDVTEVEIKVEVETLRMDNLLSKSGDENYITLYSTTRTFPDDFEAELTVPIVFRDAKALNLGNQTDPFDDNTINNIVIDGMTEIPLPTARKVRITVRAVCKSQINYFGFANPGNADLDSRYGTTTQLLFYKESGAEPELFLPKENVAPIKAIYLKPDPDLITEIKDVKVHYQLETSHTLPNVVQRLAQQLGVVAKGLTLLSKKGERVIFGCNSKIQHHLAPDQSSITFASKADLTNHWIGCIVYRINRDWSWDALEDVSFTISRNKKFRHDAAEEMEMLAVGDIEMKHYASFESLIPDDFGIINRHYTTLIFIDAIEPKTALTSAGGQLRFPDELEVDYVIKPRFKKKHGSPMELKPEKLLLPTTIIPAQVPKIVSVGLAFSPYRKNEKYSATEPRQRYLWVELDEPVKDPHDTLFCRLLKYAPDQLLSSNRERPAENIPDLPLPIDPEYIRSITPNQTDDMAGLSAMQAMEKASGNDDIHYLLPLPPGLHAESPELFGFFTYEFRIGHGHWSNLPAGKDNLWSTANGRFGRPLRITGMQHPAPTLLCNVNRDMDKVYASAPYAKAVFAGKNVTCDPPRTQLHCVLYAQVKQADGLEFRNILLDEKMMVLVNPLPEKIHSDATLFGTVVRNDFHGWTVENLNEEARANVLLTDLIMFNEIRNLKLDKTTQVKVAKVVKERAVGRMVNLDADTSRSVLHAFEELSNKPTAVGPIVAASGFTKASLLEGAKVAIYKDQIKTAACDWDNKEINDMLATYGLPEDSSLSVLAVEVFGNVTSFFEHFGMSLSEIKKFTKSNPEIATSIEARQNRSKGALTDSLGQYRILRTSPLTEVPFVCCTA